MSFVQASGIVVSDAAQELWNQFKLKRSQYKYVVLAIDDDKIVEFDYGLPKSATYEDFYSTVLEKHENEPRYILLDFDYKTHDGRDTDKLIFVTWNPDSTTVRKKMLYSSTKLATTQAFEGIAKEVTATDASELDHEHILEVIGRI